MMANSTRKTAQWDHTATAETVLQSGDSLEEAYAILDIEMSKELRGQWMRKLPDSDIEKLSGEQAEEILGHFGVFGADVQAYRMAAKAEHDHREEAI